MNKSNTPAADPRPLDHDPVNRPSHYREHPSGIECIQITEHMTFLRGNAMKYLWRAGSKGDKKTHLEDLKKARWYLDREIGNLEAESGVVPMGTTVPPEEKPNIGVGVGTPLTRGTHYSQLPLRDQHQIADPITDAPMPLPQIPPRLREQGSAWDGYPPDRNISQMFWLRHTDGSVNSFTWLPKSNAWQLGYGVVATRMAPATAARNYTLHGKRE